MALSGYVTGKRAQTPQTVALNVVARAAHAVEIPTVRLGNLSNAIHPIFRRSNFTLDGDDDYITLTDALRLASRLISREAPLAVWYTLFKGPVKETTHVLYPCAGPTCDEKAGSPPQPGHWEYTRHPETLTEVQICVVEAMFLAMADRLRFAPFDHDTFATTTAPDVNGKITIFVPRLQLQELRQAMAYNSGDTRSHARHALMAFSFAVSVCHELAHAVPNTYRDAPRRHHHYYFPGCAMSEDGFVWESAVFGGVFDLVRDHLGRPQLGLTPWPGDGHLHGYLTQSVPVGLRLAHSASFLPPRADGAFVSPFYLLHPSAYEPLFTERFWTCELPRAGSDSLRFDLAQATYRPFRVGHAALRELVRVFTGAESTLSAGALTPEAQAEFGEWVAPWHQFLDDCEADGVECD